MQLTPRCKRVIDLAYEEARLLSNSYIGSEHLLLGMLREGESLAARTLQNLGLTLESVRGAVAALRAESRGEGPEEVDQARRRGAGGPADVLLPRIAGHLAALFRADPSLETLPPDELLAVLRAGARKAEDAPSAPPPAGAVSIAKTRPGDLGHVQPAEGRRHAELARTPEAFAELLAAYEARDVHGYYELTTPPPDGPEAAPVALLLAGTPLKALTSAASLTPRGPTRLAERLAVHQAIRVRVLGGEHGMEVGWLMRDAFARTGTDDAPFPPTERE